LADSSLSPFCVELTAAKFLVLGKENVEFQFPPKILSDTNMSDWLEVSIWSYEPLRIHKGSAGRKVNMEWEYIATDNVFNAKKIYGEIHKLKTYFFGWKGGNYPIVRVNYTLVLQDVPFRLRNLNITHSPEIVRNKGTYPLYTKVACVLELATNVSSLDKEKRSDKPKMKQGPAILDKHW